MKKVTKLIAPPFVIIAFCLLTFGGCKKKSNDDNKPKLSFDVTLVSLTADCGVPLIDFKEEDMPYVHEITGNSSFNRYNAYNLDKRFDEPGQVLTVTIRKVKENELTACLAFGLAYPAVAIVSARLKE